MSWQVIIYNHTTDKVVEVLNLGHDDGVPLEVFDKVKSDSTLSAYFHYLREDNVVRWGLWDDSSGSWKQEEQVPDQVKLVGVLAE